MRVLTTDKTRDYSEIIEIIDKDKVLSRIKDAIKFIESREG